MTLQHAIEVLNAHRHGTHDDWYAEGAAAYQKDSGGSPILSAFEACAIAAAYERQREPPPYPPGLTETDTQEARLFVGRCCREAAKAERRGEVRSVGEWFLRAWVEKIPLKMREPQAAGMGK